MCYVLYLSHCNKGDIMAQNKLRKYVNAQEIFHPVVLFFIKCRIIKKLLFAVKLDIDFTFTASTKIGKFGNENKNKDAYSHK